MLATSGAALGEARVLVTHAAGFCKETLTPFIVDTESLIGPVSATLIDGRGHGASTPHPGPYDWHSATMDIVDLLDGIPDGAIGVGHSWGAALLARAEILRPGSFCHLVLIEPIVFPPPYTARDHPLSIGASRRRSTFASRDAAYERFASGPFQDWDTRALAGYVDNGFAETDDGWSLRCDREVEAEVFRQGSNVDTWDRLPELGCPATMIAGEYSTTHFGDYLADLTARFPDVQVEILAGLGHLAPMQDPMAVARLVAPLVVSD